MILLLAMLQVASADIVVKAHKRRCDISVANRILSNREFNRRAAEWAAGVPVRVHAPDGASRKCLAKIFFRLADRGVQRAEFVETPAP